MLGEKGRITLRRLGLAALDTLFPPRCFGCGRYGSFLCSSCDVSAPRLEQPFCRICAQPGATVGVCIECAHRPPPVEGISTMFACAEALKAAGSASVWGLALAREGAAS